MNIEKDHHFKEPNGYEQLSLTGEIVHISASAKSQNTAAIYENHMSWAASLQKKQFIIDPKEEE